MKIPRIFHQIWLGPKPIPNIFRECQKSWMKLYPDWTFKIWTDNNLPRIKNKRLYDSVGTYAGRSDILRLEILYKYGGVYLDMDYEAYKDIIPLIKNLDFFIGREKDGMIMNCIIGCVPEHPEMKRLIDEITPYALKHDDCIDLVKAYNTTGPKFLNDTLNEEKITIFPYTLLYPCDWSDYDKRGILGLSKDYPDAYGNHLWTGTWIGCEGETKL